MTSQRRFTGDHHTLLTQLGRALYAATIITYERIDAKDTFHTEWGKD